MLVTNLLRSGRLQTETYDYIVVGAGPAGCALAAGLSDVATCTVLLLEAGKHYGRIDQYPSLLRRTDQYSFSLGPGQNYPAKPRFSMFTWSYEGHLNEYLRARIVRGRVVGGSSAINGGSFTRGRPQDYQAWADAGNRAWSFQEVLPALRAIETDLDFGATDLHGATGPIHVRRGSENNLAERSLIFLEAARRAGFKWDPDMNGLSTGGIGLTPLNVIDGVRQNAGATFIDRVLARENLSLLDQTTAVRIIFDKETAVGVEARHRGSVYRLYANEVVLCASGINSPHLLMLSGVGPADMLLKAGINPLVDVGAIGRNLADHPYVIFPVNVPNRPGRGPGGGGLALNYSSEANDNEDLSIIPPVSRPTVGQPGEASNLGFLCGLSAPQSRGQLILRSPSPRHGPIIKYNYLSEADDRRRLRDGLRMTVQLLEDPAYRRIGAEQTALSPQQLKDDEALDYWIATHLWTSYHSAGTCKMGPDQDATAVVDQYCRVRGVNQLRVVDASIVPTITTRGMHATAAMIGQHAISVMRR